MKKHKKFKEVTPVMETVTNEPIRGSVGEFIELLKEFPADGKFSLEGAACIGLDDERAIKISPKTDSELTQIDMSGIESECCGECIEGCTDCDYSNPFVNEESSEVAKVYTLGLTAEMPEFANIIRTTSSDAIIGVEVMSPVPEELAYEKSLLHPDQKKTIDEIRKHNAYIAECLSEMHRREISALLEYQTQCLAHGMIDTNKVMCEIVDNN